MIMSDCAAHAAENTKHYEFSYLNRFNLVMLVGM